MAERFRLERDLVDEVARRAPSLFRRRKCVIRREWAVGPRVADLAGGIFARAPRLEFGLEQLPRTNFLEMRFLAHVLSRPLRSDSLSRLLLVSPECAKKMSERLERLGLVERAPTGSLSAARWREFLPAEFILFEAKLDDWRNAVRQGRYYATHSDRVVVVLPDSLSQPVLANARAACRAAGMGLLIVSPSGALRFASRPPRSKERDAFRSRLSSLHFLKTVATEMAHGRGACDA